MSELIETRVGNSKMRLGFMAGVSALALLSAICSSQASELDREDHPTVWIELGGQLERVDGVGSPFSPAFLAKNSDSIVFEPTSPLEAQRPSRFGLGEEGKISFQPSKSNWVLSAAVRYGRSNASKDFQHQTEGQKFKQHFLLSQPAVTVTEAVHSFSEVESRQQESHLILDFQAGRDVGLGFWRMAGDFNVGVRFAQFTSRGDANLHARPDVILYQTHPFGNPQKYLSKPHFHDYVLAGNSERSFHGIGPSLSWNGAVPLVSGDRDALLGIDMGVNGAILFGRQKANVAHQTTARYFKQIYDHPLPGQTNQPGGNSFYKTQYMHGAAHARSHSVTVPNIGAFAGLSYRINSFKMSAGYRADFFFGAMDAGIDTADRVATSFHGPYASISIGLGN